VNKNIPNILLVNPWIHDFAAYDFWAKPVGVLTLASILRDSGYEVTYIDCLDRFHPKAPESNPEARYGRGPFLKTQIPKPEGFEKIPRNFSRYGIKPEWFMEDLALIKRPDLILVTSLMTYWYPGVQETIGLIKKFFPDTPVILGGIYASLCYKHAVINSGADAVMPGLFEKKIIDLAEKYTGFSTKKRSGCKEDNDFNIPAFDLQRKITYVPLITSRGCPFSCSYCASNFLNPKHILRPPESVVSEIIYWHKKYNVKDFIFYDDALLIDSGIHAIPILKRIIDSNIKIRFHTPNAIHIRQISKELAEMMFKAGFKTLRLGLETAAFEDRKKIDNKVTADEFKRSVNFLKGAGFKKNQIGAYLLAGLPGQTMKSIEDSIATVKDSGITPILAYYSPIPHTAMWKKAVACSDYDLDSDPVFTNNAVFPCFDQAFSWKAASHLKNLARV